MKSYNKCEGCGIVLQSNDINALGYVPDAELSICKKCFRAKNYGEFSNNLDSFYKLEEIKEIKNDNVIMIIDILNPYETLIDNINEYVEKENLILLVNKIDILPRSIPYESVIDWIAEIAENKNIEFDKFSLVSANKRTNIDAVADFILESDKNTSIIGYSNVGKSSIIKSLFNAINKDINNLITNSIGTTKEIIELEYENKIIKDYPGIILEGSYQNIMNINELKTSSPKKEMKITNFQLGEFQTIEISKLASFSIKKQSWTLGYQFTFSNLVNLHRGKYKENLEMITYKIEHKKGNRYDLIISGLGIITFKSNGQELELSIPKGIKFNIVNSLYQ